VSEEVLRAIFVEHSIASKTEKPGGPLETRSSDDKPTASDRSSGSRAWPSLFSQMGENLGKLSSLEFVKRDPACARVMQRIAMSSDFEQLCFLIDALTHRISCLLEENGISSRVGAKKSMARLSSPDMRDSHSGLSEDSDTTSNRVYLRF